MLMLTLKQPNEKKNEHIKIVTKSGEEIEIHLSKVRGKQAQVGFKCDKQVSIRRIKKIEEFKGIAHA